MLSDLLNHEQVMVRIGTAAFIVFAPLYIISGMGYDWAGTVAVLAFIGIVVKNFGRDFKGNVTTLKGSFRG